MLKAQQAKEAIEANPQKSNRAIAEEIWADKKSIREARTVDQSVAAKVGVMIAFARAQSELESLGTLLDVQESVAAWEMCVDMKTKIISRLIERSLSPPRRLEPYMR